MSNLCQYVDVFYGNGETDRFFEDGLASKWFYIKALCGNTIPHATLPFGKMSVGAYSGGYPTGYGTHYPNGCGGIKKTGDVPLVKGFSHLHQSGTGAIQYYYNYAVTTPFYGTAPSETGHPLSVEEARPGYYKAVMQDIACELTVDGGVAVHRYTFGADGGRVAVDFSNNGLDKLFGERFYADVKDPELVAVSACEVVFSGTFSGVRLHFCVRAEAEGASVCITDPFGVTFDFTGKRALLRVGYSTLSAEGAEAEVAVSTASFEAAAARAQAGWEAHLGAIQIQTDNKELKQKFYSCLYHSLVKPCDLGGECVLGVAGDTVTDLATLWDQYKTVLPLIYFCYPDMGSKLARGLVNISRTLGKIPCSFGTADVFPCEEQAKMLGVLSLCDAYHMGLATAAQVEECITRELERADYKPFLEGGVFERYTHILDVTDACLCAAEIVQAPALKARLLQLAANWRRAYDADGLLSQSSPYYEGDRYTYSFRLQKNMAERVALAGGKERFAAMLDRFFGFGEASVKQLTHRGAAKEIEACRYHRFEGFNNECDMEAPYAYLFADRHDRLCEILHKCVHRSFGTGRSGLPGNNDSGGLSSLFVWNALGLFPVSGGGQFLLGAPQIEGATLTLSNGNVLRIAVERTDATQIYVASATWNGKPVEGYRLFVGEVMQGGTLRFCMK